MASTKVPITISYHKPGTQPPIYVAGSYSQPQWQPEEMDAEIDEQGNHIFKKEILAEPGSTAQYKIRLGHGEWWVLNESAETATDNAGNRNNIVKAPERVAVPGHLSKDPETEAGLAIAQNVSSTNDTDNEQEDRSRTSNGERTEASEPTGLSTHETSTAAPKSADNAAPIEVEEQEATQSSKSPGKISIRRLSTVPLTEGEYEISDVAGSAGRLLFNRNHGSSSFAESFLPDSGRATPTEEQCPLFSHECIGTYDHDNADVDEDLSDEEVQEDEKEPQKPTPPPNKEHNQYDLDGIDLDDPRFERFPSDRKSILAAMRRLETSTTEDQAHTYGVTSSPVVSPHRHHSREDLPNEVAVESPMLESRGRPEHTRLEVPRQTLGSTASNRSQSLHSISEELGESEEAEEARVVLPSPEWGSKSSQALHSDDDEGVVMKSTHQQKPDAPDDIKQSESEREDLEFSPRTGIPDIAEPAPDSAPSAEGTIGLNTETEGGGASEVENGDRMKGSPRITIRKPESGDDAPASADGTTNHTTTAKSTSVDSGRDSQLTRRGGQDERPKSSTSVRSAGKEVGKENFLQAFFRVLFVDWIGGLISRICGGRRKA